MNHTTQTATPTRHQRRTERMRQTLLETAETLLIEGGAAAVSAEEVARRADVSLQTVYNRIGGKPALLMAIAQRAVDENRAYMDAAYDGKGTAQERLWRACAAYVRFAQERPHQFRILADPPDEPEAQRLFAEIAEQHIAHLTAVIRDSIDAGLAAADLNPSHTAVALWAMMNGVLAMALRTGSPGIQGVTAEHMVQTAVRLLELGVKQRAQQHSGSDAPPISFHIGAHTS